MSSSWVLSSLQRVCGLSDRVASFLVKERAAESTIPFLARYRRDATGNMDEHQLRRAFDQIEELAAVDKRRARMLEDLRKRGVALEPDLERALNSATTSATLEDLFEPFKQKRDTNAEKGRQAGYEEPAKQLLTTLNSVNMRFDRLTADQRKFFIALLCESLSRHVPARQLVIDSMHAGEVESNLRPKPKPTSKMSEKEFQQLQNNFKRYDNFLRRSAHLHSYQILALFRGENKGVLKVKFHPSENPQALQRSFTACLKQQFQGVGRHYKSPEGRVIQEAVEHALKQVLSSADTAVRRTLWEKASKASIEVFQANLRCLLLQRPLEGARLLAIDPGFGNGCKVACLSETGDVLGTGKFFLQQKPAAFKSILGWIAQHALNKIVIGNGTACRETEQVVAELIKSENLDIEYSITSETGASVYSVSEAANEELGHLDMLFRGAVSIGRRLQNPLSELVKIPPASIGVGMYQHDLKGKELEKKLAEEVGSCVAEVGLNVNQASKYALRCLPGMKPATVEQLLAARPVNSRDELKKVKGMTAGMFTSVAGFLRVPESKNQLDNTICHPEAYDSVKKILKLLRLSLDQRDRTFAAVESFGGVAKLAESIGIGVEEAKLLVEELAKPRQDPRASLPYAGVFRKDICSFDSLREGMEVSGVVSNVTEFGAFIDIGVGKDGLLPARAYAGRNDVCIGSVLSLKIASLANDGKINLEMIPVVGKVEVGKASRKRPREEDGDDQVFL